MARIFTPWYLFLVNRLQQRGTAFNLEETLTQPYSPLRAALTAYFTMGELGALTCIVDSDTAEGRIISIEARAGGPTLASTLRKADQADFQVSLKSMKIFGWGVTSMMFLR